MNKAAREKALEVYKALLPQIQEKYPEIFHNKFPKVLDYSVNKALQQEFGIGNEEVNSFLRIWCGSYRYLGAIIRGALRYNLSGVAVRPISYQERVEATRRYHNFQLVRHQIKDDPIGRDEVFNKQNVSAIMYDNWCAHKQLNEASGDDFKVEQLYDVDEINFIVRNYKGDRNEADFQEIVTAYLKINGKEPTLKTEDLV